MRPLIAAHKIFWFILLCFITIPLIAIWCFIFNHTKVFHAVARLYYTLTRKIFFVSYEIKGNISRDHTVYVGNHLSYIDIPLLGSFLNATFVAKEEVKKWPILGVLSTLAKTVFISRTPEKAQSAVAQMHDMINQNRSLILFPEGTSTQGDSVLPFKSSLFEIFLSEKVKEPLFIQPFTIIPIETDGKAVRTHKNLDRYAWYGDMNLEPHLWQLAKSKGMKVRILFHPPYQASHFDNRKKLTVACFDDVSNGLHENLMLPP